MTVSTSWEPPDMGSLGASALNHAIESIVPEVTHRTPRLEGDLRSSMSVHHATPGNHEAGVSFSSPYAVYQHELNTANRTEPGTTSHYLEGPWLENEELMRQIMAGVMRGGLS